jgi:periplasmic protein TonB
MIRQTLFLVACLVIGTVACKSGNKEVAVETPTDTTKVVEPVGVITIDSAAVAEENMKPASNTPAKPAESKTTGATGKPAGSTTKATETDAAKGYVEFPSKRATYPGGEAALNKYLADNIKYPAMARENRVEGTVYASILVDEHGNILDVSFPKPLGNGLEDEVLRVIKGMPALIPAEDHSKPVKTKYMLPVKFKLM